MTGHTPERIELVAGAIRDTIKRFTFPGFYPGAPIRFGATEHDLALAALDVIDRPPAIDAAHLEHQRAWSRETFGPADTRGPLGPLAHIRKELDEIADDPAVLEEWVDVIILAFDGAWRAGHEPQAIIDAVKAKQTKNEDRDWPDWRGVPADQPIEHVRRPELCRVCGRDNDGGTHDALERSGHVAHAFVARCCDRDQGGSHYHCARCNGVTGMYGHYRGGEYRDGRWRRFAESHICCPDNCSNPGAHRA